MGEAGEQPGLTEKGKVAHSARLGGQNITSFASDKGRDAGTQIVQGIYRRQGRWCHSRRC